MEWGLGDWGIGGLEDWRIGGFSRVERVERVEAGRGVIYLTQRRKEAESAEGIGEL